LGFVDTAPHLGGKIPPKHQFWGVNRRFLSQTREIEKHAHYQNDCIDSNQTLHSDKDHQMPLVGGSNTHITNPRWRIGRHLGKIEKSPYLGRILTDFDQIRHGNAVWLS